ncbi:MULTISPECIES: ATP-dependent nuclease [Bacteria]|uniref:ATP-dependent nuclease n=1 Tax=Bacteria TaxID=2 RepID=UPI003F404991
MILKSLEIKGFRQLEDVKVLFDQATFLIGENNVGKSSILKALELFLSGDKQPASDEDYCLFNCEKTLTTRAKTSIIELTGIFENIPKEANNWRGFKGRIEKYDPIDENDSGLRLTYRKTYSKPKECKIEILLKKRVRKYENSELNNVDDLLGAGVTFQEIQEVFPTKNYEDKFTAPEKKRFDEFDSLYDVLEDEEWSVENPGGIQGNILSKLPKYIYIPARDEVNTMDTNKNSPMSEILTTIFDDIKRSSRGFAKLSDALKELEQEMNFQDSTTDYHKMITQLNKELDKVFPTAKINAIANLSDSDKILKPQFEISLSSNVETSVSQQGTGMIRASVFSILKFREQWLKERNQRTNTLIIGFEEPEIYLHPNAATQMKDAIYDLVSSELQIICTTHSPYMIGLGRDNQQVLNRITKSKDITEVNAFNLSDKYKELMQDDKNKLKMLMKIDDYIAKVFFSKKVIVVEGDTEELVFKETLKSLPAEEFKINEIKNDFQIIKARGKAVIISLVKYLKALNLDVYVIHDRDKNTQGAVKFNEPIRVALNDDDKLFVLEENIEQTLEYEPPIKDKPFIAYMNLKDLSWENYPLKWVEIINNIFSDYRK